MKKLNKNYIIEAILVAVAVVAIYSIVQVNVPLTSAAVSGVDIGSSVCIYYNDQLVGDECTHNAMMTDGLNFVKTLIGNWSGGGNPVKWIALGNTSSAETDQSALPGEATSCALSRAEGAYATVGNGNWSITKQFTVTGCTGGNIVINTTALFNNSASGMMFAGKNFSSPVTLMNGDQLNITWYIWVT